MPVIAGPWATIAGNLLSKGLDLAANAIRNAGNNPAKREKKPALITHEDAELLLKLKAWRSQYAPMNELEELIISLRDAGKVSERTEIILFTPYRIVDQYYKLSPSKIIEIENKFPKPAKPITLTDIPSAKVTTAGSKETTHELKRRLGKELYKAELDLANDLMIANSPCDCLDSKHSLLLEACCEELLSQDPDNAVYREILDWMSQNLFKCSPEAIASGKYKSEYRHFAHQFKEFRKRVLGTWSGNIPIKPPAPGQPVIFSLPHQEESRALTLEEAKDMAATEAAREVEKAWQLSEKKS